MSPLQALKSMPSQPQRLPLDLHPVPIAAAIAKMHVKSVYRLIRAGKIRCFGRRGSYRVSVSDLLPVVEPGTQNR
jgi:hypothetical protein